MNDKEKEKDYRPGRRLLILLYLLLPTLTYLFTMFIIYDNEKRNIESEVNRHFHYEAPHWCDSIRYGKNMKITIKGYNSAKYKVDRVQKHRVIADHHGNCTVPGKHIYEKNYFLHNNKQSNLELASAGMYDIVYADSLWEAQLRRQGLKVNTALIMTTKELRDVFPTKDSLNRHAVAVSDTSRIIDFDAAFRTDTAYISHRDLIGIVGFAHIPFTFILQRTSLMQIMLTAIFLLYLLYITMKSLVWLNLKNLDKKVMFIGNAVVVKKEKIMLCANGKESKLKTNELAILKILTDSNGRVNIQDIIDLCWKGFTEESARKNFNGTYSTLCKSLENAANVSLKREKNEIIYIEKSNFFNRIMRETRLILYILKHGL